MNRPLEVEPALGPASLAIEAVVDMLADAEIEATRDAGAFYPHPIGVLVALPTLVARGMSSRTYEIPVLVVSGDPLNSELAVDRLYRVADAASLALACDSYRPTPWSGGANAEPLPALELTVTTTVTEV